jgi:hypothetical protein
MELQNPFLDTVEIDKSGYTLASAVEAMNGDEDLREVNTTGVDIQHQVSFGS